MARVGVVSCVALAAVAAALLLGAAGTSGRPEALPPGEEEVIIIGAGAAGSVVGSRLGHNGRFIAVIEAGIDPHAEHRAEDGAGENKKKDKKKTKRKKARYDEESDGSPRITTLEAEDPWWPPASKLPAEEAQALEWGIRASARNGGDPLVDFPVGRIAGGTAALRNGAVWSRGSPFDMESWAKVTNDKTWEEHMLAFHKGVEEYFPGPASMPDGARRGREGPTSVMDAEEGPLVNTIMTAAALALKVPFSRDVNDGRERDGASLTQFAAHPSNYSSGARAQDSYHTELRPRVHDMHEHLQVLTGCAATRLLFEDENNKKRVTGVEFRVVDEAGGQGPLGTVKKLSVAAAQNGVVVIAAGALLTPKLLMQSGIGPAPHWNSVAELPGVGQNLMEQPFVAVVGELDASLAVDGADHTDEDGGWITSDWDFNEGEFPSSSFWSEVQLFGSADGTYNEHAPDFQLRIVARKEGLPGLFEQVGIDKEAFGRSMVCMVRLLQPKSRGSVTLPEGGPELGLPDVRLNMLSEEEDVAKLVAGVKQCRKLMAAKVMQRLLPLRETQPSSSVKSDEDLADWVRDNVHASYHASGTARMGTADQVKDGAVVDSRLRVLGGVEGVYIADTSVFPTPVSAEPLATVVAVARRAAYMILEDEREARKISGNEAIDHEDL